MDDDDRGDGELDALNMIECLMVEGLSQCEIQNAIEGCLSPEEAIRRHDVRVKSYLDAHPEVKERYGNRKSHDNVNAEG